MPDMDSIDLLPDRFTADQCRARAEIVRSTANQVVRPTMRRQLLRVAEEYEALAERLEAVCLS